MEDREVTEIAVVVNEFRLFKSEGCSLDYEDEIVTPQGNFLLQGKLSNGDIRVGAVLCLRRTSERPCWYPYDKEMGEGYSRTGRAQDCYLWEVVKDDH